MVEKRMRTMENVGAGIGCVWWWRRQCLGSMVVLATVTSVAAAVALGWVVVLAAALVVMAVAALGWEVDSAAALVVAVVALGWVVVLGAFALVVAKIAGTALVAAGRNMFAAA